MDKGLFLAINSAANWQPLLDLLGVFFASWLAYLIIAWLIGLLFYPQYRKMALSAMAAGVLARGVIVSVIRFFYQRPRPFVAMDDVHQLVSVFKNEYNGSFPSGHASFFFAVAMAVYFYNQRWGYYLFAGALLMGVARVYAGVHWPSDIIGGAIVGIFSAWVTHAIIKKYQSRQ